MLADVGGTNARFARCDLAGNMYARTGYIVADFDTFRDALTGFLGASGGPKGCAGAAVAAAGPLENQRIALTNADWEVSAEDVTDVLGDVPVHLANDLEAVANALPSLSPPRFKPVGDISAPARDSSRLLVINVGTGFGAALAVRNAGEWLVVPSEAGHMSFGAESEIELSLLRARKSDTAPVSVEDVLSGPGLLNLYQSLCERNADVRAAETPEQVFDLAAANVPSAEEAISLFTVWLARSVKNLVFTTAAWDGVFLCGGVIDSWSRHADSTLFRQHFSKTTKLQEKLASTFTGIILDPDAALAGLVIGCVGAWKRC